MVIKKIIKTFFNTSLIVGMCCLGITFAFATNGDIPSIKKNFNFVNLNFIDDIAELNDNAIDNIKNIYNEDANEEKVDLVLVNKDNKLNEKYVPSNLVEADIPFQGINNKISVDIKSNLENMFNDANLDGVELVGISGYRSYSYQENLYNMSLRGEGDYNSDYVALPGYSEHQTGLAIDILSTDYMFLDEGFKYTDAYKWLNENSYKYGFIIRYPEGKEDITGYPFEPWHLRYVGIQNAKKIIKRGCTLEEYLK